MQTSCPLSWRERKQTRRVEADGVVELFAWKRHASIAKLDGSRAREWMRRCKEAMKKLLRGSRESVRDPNVPTRREGTKVDL